VSHEVYSSIELTTSSEKVKHEAHASIIREVGTVTAKVPRNKGTVK